MKLRKKQVLAIVMAIVTVLTTLSFPSTVHAMDNNFHSTNWLNNLTVVSGEDLTLEATVTGYDLSNVTYEWRRVVLRDYYVGDYSVSYESSEVIAGENQATMTLRNVTEPGDYTCYAYDGYGNHAYSTFHVGLENHFAAKAHRDGNTYYDFKAPYGGNTTIQVDVFGDDLDGVTYQWYRAAREEGQEYTTSNGFTLVSGATGNTCLVENVTDVVTYECRIRDGYGNSAKVMMNVYVDNQLTVKDPNETISITPGQTLKLEALVSATYMDGITYQWSYRGPVVGVDGSISTQQFELTGATESTYETVVSDACTYSCTIKDRFGGYAYKNIQCIIDNNFSAVQEESSLGVIKGEKATLVVNVTADKKDKLTFKWWRIEQYIGNDGEHNTIWDFQEEVTGDTFVTPEITENTTYYCSIEDGYGSKESLYFYVYVTSGNVSNLRAYAVKSDIKVKPGEEAELEVAVSGTNANNVSYQWHINVPTFEDDTLVYADDGSLAYTLVALPEAIQNKLVISKANASVEYVCTVTDLKTQNIYWVYFTVTTENHLGIEPDYQSYAVSSGESVTLSATAHADDESAFYYQWFYGEEAYDEEYDYTYVKKVPIKDATSNTYKTEPITEATQYFCEVFDRYLNCQTASFDISIKNQLQAKPASYTREYPYGEKATLKVEVSALDTEGITYEWEKYQIVYGEDGRCLWYGETLLEKDKGTDTFVTEPVTEAWEYQCIVRDAYGNSQYITFPVYVENHFRVSKKPNAQDSFDDYDRYYLGQDGTVTLDFKARADQTKPVRYILRREEEEGTRLLWDGARKLFELDQPGEYALAMIDAYGRETTCDFYVHEDPKFSAEAVGGSEKVVPVGEDVTLQVNTSADPKNLTYDWVRLDAQYDSFGEISYYDYHWLGCDGPSLEVENVTEKKKYICSVSDESGSNGAEVEFIVYAGAKQSSSFISNYGAPVDETLWVPEGETLKLQAVAEGLGENLTYHWMEEVYTEDIRFVYRWSFTDVTGSEFVVKPASDGLIHCYECTIRDEDGREEWVTCDVYVKKDCTVTFQANGGSGSMVKDVAQKYFSYQLPECKFTAPAGKEFAGWEVGGELYEEGETLVAGGNITVKATWEKKQAGPSYAIIRSCQAGFEGNLHLYFNMMFSDALLADEKAYVEIVGEQTVRILLKDGIPTTSGTEERLTFPYLTFANELRKNIVLRVYDGSGHVVSLMNKAGDKDFTEDGFSYSLYTYATKMLESPEPGMPELAQALIDYGTAAQYYFNFETEGLPALRGEVLAVKYEDLAAFAPESTGSKFAGVAKRTLTGSFEADNAVYISYYLPEGADVSGYEFKVYDTNGKLVSSNVYHETVTLDEESGKNTYDVYRLSVQGLAADELGNPYVFKMIQKDTAKEWTVTASVLTYARSSISKEAEDPNRANLGRALYLYYQAAENYFK